jgi:hypothetical protein
LRDSVPAGEQLTGLKPRPQEEKMLKDSLQPADLVENRAHTEPAVLIALLARRFHGAWSSA